MSAVVVPAVVFSGVLFTWSLVLSREQVGPELLESTRQKSLGIAEILFVIAGCLCCQAASVLWRTHLCCSWRYQTWAKTKLTLETWCGIFITSAGVKEKLTIVISCWWFPCCCKLILSIKKFVWTLDRLLMLFSAPVPVSRRCLQGNTVKMQSVTLLLPSVLHSITYLISLRQQFVQLFVENVTVTVQKYIFTKSLIVSETVATKHKNLT